MTNAHKMTDTRSIELLLDKQELHDLVARLCRGVDRQDRELIESCYHPDSYDDHGPISGTGAEFADAIVTKAKGVWMHHCVSNELFEIDGDVAWGEIYVVMHSKTAAGRLLSGCGRYIDRYERRNGEWRITRRTVITEYVDPESGHNTADYTQGSQDRNDPCYRRD